ncbi:Unknown protein sequence [Pseudomonas amygdali pv. myricae]|uniref:Uncharacterized protein n=1 Tax=Pseudomonas syringae pv. castaneae TaxID=264450 RepID=A0A0P9QJZ9_PSESX|nr:Unknown protein sequence [Pseudomonas syringae pv. castaneae]KPX91731.1 Unknown protein sequence [Pseudomonas amygdali pv. myricae]RMV02034.1 hypothetical protein ALP18_200141 [Pseudomonas amygdali pv. myricae]
MLTALLRYLSITNAWVDFEADLVPCNVGDSAKHFKSISMNQGELV